MPLPTVVFRLAMIGGAALTAALVGAVGGQAVDAWTLRSVLVGTLVLLTWASSPRPARAIWLSPLFLLAGWSLVFYSLIPALLLAIDFDLLTGTMEPTLIGFSGQPADVLILVFSGVCQAGAALCAAVLGSHRPASTEPAPLLAGDRQRLAFMALAIAAAAGHFLGARLEVIWRLSDIVPASLVQNVLDGLPPLQAIIIMVLLVDAMASRKYGPTLAVAATLAACAAVEVATGNSKFPVYLVLVAALTWVVKSRHRWQTKAAVCVVASVFALGSLSLMSQIRGNTAYTLNWSTPDIVGQGLAKTLLMKIGERQYETGYCLGGVLRKNAGQPGENSPFYFISALVPRFLWPDKPNLSPFNHYAAAYCGGHDLNPLHSASITLLGEPIEQAGMPGLRVALAVLLAGLSILAVSCLNNNSFRFIIFAALTPWLMDFDQNYSLYWTNALKMAIYMLPVLALVAVLRGRVR